MGPDAGMAPSANPDAAGPAELESFEVPVDAEPALEAAVEAALLEGVDRVPVTFYFDPSCPWTWRASRWLVDVAPRHHLEIEWAAFSLALLNEGDIAEQDEAKWTAAQRALRIVEALRADGRHETTGHFYTTLGNAVFHDRRELDDELIRKTAHFSLADDATTAMDDPSWDNAVRASLEQAMQLAGPGIGSPVLAMGGARRGFSGPILKAVPTGVAADRLFDAVSTLIRMPEFCEVKRGRS
jgi:2-hydroxychromene-2-carboxylate isomerase